MKRKFIFLAMLVVLLAVSGCGKKNEGEAGSALEQELFEKTLAGSKQYLELRIKTDDILVNARKYGGYEKWKAEMDGLIGEWDDMAKKAEELEKIADEYIPSELGLVKGAKAVTKEEINNVFDKAPAGKKIKTLAKFLGVDAKRAFLMLKQTQEEVKAEAWTEAGDQFKKLENSAIVIKDGCKVAGFVGGVIISGGTAGFAAASTMTKAAVIIGGADLTMEVTEDAANIALGNDNEISELVGDVRKITEPAAAILSITSLPENLASGFDKFNGVMIAIDQFRSAAQEGKVVGIALPAYNNKDRETEIEAATGSTEEIRDWLKENGYEVEEKIETEEEKTKSEAEAEAVPEPVGQESNTETQEQARESASDTQKAKASGESGVSVNFVSPTEGIFLVSQARMWKAEISGTESGETTKCYWSFYIDGALHKEMPGTCHFTSTFIDKPGSLRAEVKVEVLKNRVVYDENGNFVESVKDVVDTITASRDYSVVKTIKN
ncbi:hypothetical protein A2303_05465 [Candidatus Falkowbacteria bacterium RIFOXYB2_FULL_47_14]|uniref:DUF5667 domain-containing protein n=1 Tax=Candidatus Falkowbacteria bacterium RIFOXYA2_FULL_47_19 TaxID=1797994 RepID=A0A1F5SEP3_9BACT|nr:MAG: hypothetical protein A2227_06870 [Candidatus Falkowbacteria bacterium RIFOXYA2_FULL_47_19]OGF35298.1 MAG: hypothetical protein A2468_00020 [Candidatus Falkowbacteria bacterium RIFOXYC2_FULL_46_15]OGF43735.1 MAG: hypothetical protein A2303_05465 [Candidatus Falkowbacteria bacterium RIFOXYB2_FULL_47_14]